MRSTSLLDKNDYHFSELKNGLRTLIVTDSQADKSACALAVRTGSYDDNIPGIAHFLEHMLFMGTEKYPCENDFTDFLSKHNGSTNAYTNSETTIYFFDVDPHFFIDALERFSHFFKTPLFLNGSVDRELKAVDSEHKNNLNTEDWRICRLTDVCSNDEYANFSTGNQETLNVDGIRDRVKQFWLDNYSSDNMCLAAFHEGNIEDKVQEFFEGIPRMESTRTRRITSFVDYIPQVFQQELLSRVIKMVPRNDIKELRIQVEVPIEREQYRNNTYGYISFVLQRECKGTLIYLLKNKGLIFDLDVNFSNTYSFSIFELRLKLTSKGFENHLEVMHIVYNCINSLSFEEEEYLKIKRTKEWDFSYLESKQPDEYVTELAENMFFYPKEHLLNFDYLYEKYDKEQIMHISGIIAEPENWLIFLIGRGFLKENIDFMTEKYYDIKYAIGDKFRPNGEQSITREHDNGRFLFVYENSFKAPKSNISILLNTKIEECDYSSILYYLYMVEQDFYVKHETVLFFGSVSFESHIIPQGIQLNFYGNNIHLVQCIELYFECFKCINPIYFDLVKQMIKVLHIQEKNNPPYKRIIHRFTNAFFTFRPSVDELIEIDSRMAFEDVKLSTDFFIDVAAFGNCNFYNLLLVFDALRNDFGRSKRYIPVSNEVNESIVFETEDEVNNSVGVFIKCGDRSNYDEMASAELIVQSSSELFFDILRTKETLGYVVYNRLLYLSDGLYHNFIVQSEKSCEYLKERILRFIVYFEKNVREMSRCEFETLREGAISGFSEKFKNLNEFAYHNLDLHLTNHFNLNYKEDIKKKLDKMESPCFLQKERMIVVEAVAKKKMDN